MRASNELLYQKEQALRFISRTLHDGHLGESDLVNQCCFMYSNIMFYHRVTARQEFIDAGCHTAVMRTAVSLVATNYSILKSIVDVGSMYELRNLKLGEALSFTAAMMKTSIEVRTDLVLNKLLDFLDFRISSYKKFDVRYLSATLLYWYILCGLLSPILLREASWRTASHCCSSSFTRAL